MSSLLWIVLQWTLGCIYLFESVISLDIYSCEFISFQSPQLCVSVSSRPFWRGSEKVEEWMTLQVLAQMSSWSVRRTPMEKSAYFSSGHRVSYFSLCFCFFVFCFYLVAPGLSCSMWDLVPSLWRSESLTAACELFIATHGIHFPDEGLNLDALEAKSLSHWITRQVPGLGF